VNDRFNITVVGAGVTGLTIAALLAQSRNGNILDITVLDAAPRPEYQQGEDVALRVSAIANGSAELLDAVGAWRHVLESRACPYESMRVWDESSEPDDATTLRFDAAEFAVPQLGFIVENILLQDALLRVLDTLDVELIFDAAISALRCEGNQYGLEVGESRSLRPDLVIGADGTRSFVRESVGIATSEWPYGQVALVTHLEPKEPHRNTAWQRFMRDGPLGMLPLADGRISVVWSTDEAQVDRAMALDDNGLGRLLGEASDHVLGELKIAGPRDRFPLCARHAEQYVVPGVALIGDAAHAIHPLAGQGANLGLQDAAMLARVIESAISSGEYPGDRPVLRRYERARRGANATMLHFMTGLNRLFTTDSALVRELRTTGMQLFNNSGPVREYMVGVALGAGR